MLKLVSTLLLLLVSFPISSLILSEKITLYQRLKDISQMVEDKKFVEAQKILFEIKESHPDSEFRVIANYLLAKIEFGLNNFYKASFYIELSIKDELLNRLVASYKDEIYFMAGVIYFKIEMFELSKNYLEYSINGDFAKKDQALLLLSEIIGRKMGQFGQASIYYAQINRSKLSNDEIEKYNYLSNHLLWGQIDTSKIGYRDPNVNSIAIDKDIIFIGLYNGGLLEYNYILDTYNYYIGGNLVNENIRDIYVDESRYIYVGTQEGVSFFDKRYGTFKVVEELKGKSITTISGSEESIFFGTLGDGIISFDKKNKTFSSLTDFINISFVSYIDDTLYIAPYSGGLYLLKGGLVSSVNINIPNRYPITDIVKSDNKLFISTYGAGIYIYDLNTKRYELYNSNNTIFLENYFLCISKKDDVLYCGSLGNGIYTLDTKTNKWETFFVSDIYMGTDIKKIVFTDSMMFIATLGEGVLKKLIIK